MTHRLYSLCAFAMLALAAGNSAAHEDSEHQHAETAHSHDDHAHAQDDHEHGHAEHAGQHSGTRIQHNLFDSDFPIARAVEVPPGAQLVWHSGTVPSPADPSAERLSSQFWGDTKAQSLSVFAKMDASLKDLV